MPRQEPSFQGLVILSESSSARYVRLGCHYAGDTSYYGSVKRTEAGYDGERTTIYQFHSEEPSVKCVLDEEEFLHLVAGRLYYLINHGMAVRSPSLEETFTAYVRACEKQATSLVPSSVDLGDLDDELPF